MLIRLANRLTWHQTHKQPFLTWEIQRILRLRLRLWPRTPSLAFLPPELSLCPRFWSDPRSAGSIHLHQAPFPCQWNTKKRQTQPARKPTKALSFLFAASCRCLSNHTSVNPYLNKRILVSSGPNERKTRTISCLCGNRRHQKLYCTNGNGQFTV